MQQRFDTPHPVSLVVELRSGDLVVRAGEVTETLVEVSGQGSDDVRVDQHGDEISVVAARGRGGLLGSSGHVTVQVSCPTDSRLATKLGSADIRVEGRLGETRLRSGSGDMRIDELGAAGVVETGSGDLQVDRVSGPLQVKSGSGDVTLGVLSGPAEISSGSGDVTVDSAHGSLVVKSGSGDLRVREAGEHVALSTASGDLVVDRIERGRLTAKNASGDVTVGVPAGIPVWTDVTTVSGSVRSDLEGAGQPADGQDFVEVRARTVSGDVTLEQL